MNLTPEPRMNNYRAADIDVLKGLDPVRRRPGMYTDTTRPNHLAQEVIDNSVDEALAGYATTIRVTLHADGSLSVSDDGRGMPVDIHPEEGISGVELILTRLHAGGKFSRKNYNFSGGLHGVGVSVVNALSTRLEVEIERDGSLYRLACAHGEVVEPLTVVEAIGKRRHGTTVRFWVDESYFDSPNYAVARLKQTLKAKAVLCAGLHISLDNENTGEHDEWLYQDGLAAYLREQTGDDTLPAEPYTLSHSDDEGQIDLALFQNTIRDRIISRLRPGVANTSDYINNSGDILIRGIEIQANANLLPLLGHQNTAWRWSVFANGGYNFKMQDKGVSATANSDKPQRAYQYQAALGTRIGQSGIAHPWSLLVEGVLRGPMWYDTEENLHAWAEPRRNYIHRKSPFTVVNLRGEVGLTPNVKLFAAVNNMSNVNEHPIFLGLDEQPYKLNAALANGGYGTSMPGRMFRVGVRALF